MPTPHPSTPPANAPVTPGAFLRRFTAAEVIARGATRVCVRAPDSPAHCLKYELPDTERPAAGMRQYLRRWLSQRFPALGENRTELRAYRRLRARIGAEADTAMAACHGIVATADGPALRCDCVLDANGAPVLSLYRHIFETRIHSPEALCAAVDRFEGWLLRHQVPLFGLNSGNFVVVARIGADGRMRPELICVDTKSTFIGKELLPLSLWIPALMRRKLQRRAERLRRRIREHATAPATGSPLAADFLAD